MNIEIKDEILTGEPRYRIRDNNGNITQDNVSIEQITPTKQEATPINKALLQNIQTQMLADSKQLVFEYTTTEDMHTVEITELDLIADGGIYDIVINGGVIHNTTDGAIKMRINGVTTESYYEGSTSLAHFNTNIGDFTSKAFFGNANITLFCDGENVFYKAISCGWSSSNTATNSYTGAVIKASNVTSLQFFQKEGSATGVATGFNIRIYKRR